jgi:hypothetical protein
MNITAAALSETVIEAALSYLACNISVVACIGKRASVDWSRWQVVRPTEGYLHWCYHKGILQNVAVICGQVSQGLVIVDLDGKEAVQEYEKKFHNLITTFNVISGSGQGKHYYYRVKEVTPTTRTKGFELRSDGCYVVAPPSKHPVTGQRYRVERYRDMMMLNDMQDVQAWIRGKVETRQATNQPSIGEVRQATKYATSALSRECDIVAGAPKGSRNNLLYLAALKMGNFVQMGSIDRSEVEDALFRAAYNLSGEDGEGQSWRTIQNGINNGINSNRRRA